MPRYRYNPDGTLTILDDSSSSHQPDPGSTGGGGGNGGGSGNGEHSLFRARMHVLMILLGVVAGALMFLSLAEQGGEFSQFVHKMGGAEWAAFQKSEAPHNVMEVASKSIGEHGPDGFSIVGTGLSRCFQNLDSNLKDIGGMLEEGIEDVTGS